MTQRLSNGTSPGAPADPGLHIQRFQDGARKIAEVVECHHVTGNFDYLLRVEVPNLEAYERFHADKLAALHNVGQLVTYISMTDLTDA